MRLKPVEQGTSSRHGIVDDHAGQGKRHGRLGWMVMGAKYGYNILYSWVRGRRLWQTAAMRRRQVSQIGRWMVPPVWHRDPCALCFT